MIREILGKKIGMTQIFGDDGTLYGVTLIAIPPSVILEKIVHKDKVKVRIGSFPIPEEKKDRVKKPLLGYFEKLGVQPHKIIKEVSVIEDSEEISCGKQVGIEIFEEGEYVDVRGRVKGKGFQGGMKRHGWHGQPASHGSTTHRRIGSAGASTYPARIIKGHRMPGHMGNVYRTIKNMKIVKKDEERNLIFVYGGVPGAVGSIVLVKKK